jgi:hypothetical protein
MLFHSDLYVWMCLSVRREESGDEGLLRVHRSCLLCEALNVTCRYSIHLHKGVASAIIAVTASPVDNGWMASNYVLSQHAMSITSELYS